MAISPLGFQATIFQISRTYFYDVSGNLNQRQFRVGFVPTGPLCEHFTINSRSHFKKLTDPLMERENSRRLFEHHFPGTNKGQNGQEICHFIC